MDGHSAFSKEFTSSPTVLGPSRVTICRGSNDFHDPGLHNRSRAIHTRMESRHDQSASFESNAVTGSVKDEISLGVLCPEVFFRALMTGFNVIVTSAWEAVITH